MSSESFLPPFSSDRTRGFGVRRKRRGEKARERARARLEALESRTLLSTLPAATVAGAPVLNFSASPTDYHDISDPNHLASATSQAYAKSNESAPSITIDQNNPLKMVAVWTVDYPGGLGYRSNGSPYQSEVAGAYTTDGGQTWVQMSTSTVTGPMYIDPDIAPIPPDVQFEYASDATVTFDRHDNFYVTLSEHSGSNNSGKLIFRSFDFSGNSPVLQNSTTNPDLPGDGSTILYHWANGINEATGVTVAADSNLSSYTDPQDGSYVQTDPYATQTYTDTKGGTHVVGNVYVSWAEQDRQLNGSRWNNIVLIGSSNGGVLFTNPIDLDSGSPNASSNNNNENRNNYDPQIIISQGRPTSIAGDVVKGGAVSIVWDSVGSNNSIQTTQVANGVQVEQFNATDFTGPNAGSAQIVDNQGKLLTDLGPVGNSIAYAFDPGNNQPHDPAITTFPLQVNLTSGFTATDLNLNLALVHPNDNEIKIELKAPDGTTITLLNNATNSAGKPTGLIGGITGADLGGLTASKQLLGMTFDDQAPPLTGGGDQSVGRFSSRSGDLNSLLSNQLNGTWHLIITDYRSHGTNPPPAYIQSWGLSFNSGFTAGLTQTSTVETIANKALPGAYMYPGSSYPTSSPTTSRGVGPAPVIASDNTLGAFSPYQGRLYVAYVGGGQNIFTYYSDNGGLSWTQGSNLNASNADANNFGGAGRTVMQPSLAVDPATGTLVGSYYDAGYDAANARVAMMVTASNDGGQSFSPSSFANTALTADNGINGQTLVRGPLLDNQSGGNGNREGNFSFGTHQSLIAYNGHVVPVWSGNLDGGTNGKQALDILSSDVRIANGPRVVDSTMGPIGQLGDTLNTHPVNPSSTYDPPNPTGGTQITDNTPVAQAFQITFDRPVYYNTSAGPGGDPNAFDLSDVKVFYHDVKSGDSFVQVPVTRIVANDANAVEPNEATRFTIYFQPQTGVGTYSYEILPNLRDRIRSSSLQTITNPSVSIPSGPLNATLPPAGTGGTGTPNDTYSNTIKVANHPNQVISAQGFDVTVNLTHQSPTDLLITLTYTGSVNRTVTLYDGSTTPPTGAYNGTTHVTAFNGLPVDATYTLTISDRKAGSTGTLTGWSLTLTSSSQQLASQFGAQMDQNADGVAPNPNSLTYSDLYAAPRPLNDRPYNPSSTQFLAGPYDPHTMPLILTGPYVVRTYIPGASASNPALVLNQSVSAIDVAFDRAIDPTSFTPDQIVRVMGPAGDITNVAGPFTVTQITPNIYRITFAHPQTYSGTYTVLLGKPKSDANGNQTIGIQDIHGNPLDTNLNAGLAVLRGGLGSTGESSVTDTTQAQGADGIGGVPDVNTDPVTGQPIGPGTRVFSLNYPDNFLIPTPAQINNKAVLTVQVNISTQSDHDLTALLVGPNGSWITLFSQVTSTGGSADFKNTVFDDFASANIQNGGAPFFGSYTPGGSPPSATLLASLGLDPANEVNTLTRLASQVSNAQGTWKLAVIDNTANSIPATVNSWSVSIQRPLVETGLGEPVSDQYTGTFRIFTMDPTNPLSSDTWTALGPASIGGISSTPGGTSTSTSASTSGTGTGTGTRTGTSGSSTADDPESRTGGRSGRIGGLAVDPSDPSGNTVYVGGASGGIWKSTDFLRPGGPTYIPLTNFGPNNAINIGGIAVFGRNNDPNQSVIFATTGEGDTGTPGAGILRSKDGGATWQVLDSSTNVDAGGNLLPIDSPLRNHILVGNTSFKVAVDPNPTASGGIVVYVAMSGPNGGLWRSVDSGNHWTLMRSGQATDLVLDPYSGTGVTNGTLQNIWVAFRGEGVYFSNAQGANLQLLDGSVGDPLIQAAEDNPPPRPLGVQTPEGTPNGKYGRIVLAKPALTGNPAQDIALEGWLYAGVVNPDGTFHGLYQTKDFGQNWVQLRIPAVGTAPNQVPTNDTTKNDYDITGGGGKAKQGNYDFTLAVDAQNPNIVYMGGTADFNATGLIRIDATLASDAHALVPYSDTAPDGGTLLYNSTGPVSVADRTKAPTNYNGQAYFNFIRNPVQPFVGNATLLVTNAYNTNSGTLSKFTNDGSGVIWIPFDIGGTDQHRMLTMRDPVTGYTRIIIGDDQGVFTILDNNGQQLETYGSNPAAGSDRNGNLQITQFYYGAAQPDGSAFYGSAQDDGGPAGSNVLGTGNLTWNGPGGDAGGVATDQQGPNSNPDYHALYQYWWPCCGGNYTDFFQVNGTGRTYGLLQQSGSGSGTGTGTVDPQWPFTGVANFAVNPLSGDQVIISSFSGNIFRTEDQGVLWTQIASFGTKALALAYGAPDPTAPAGIGNLDNFLYVGTTGGKLHVSRDGGGTWTDISAGLDGSAIQSIVPNPTRGSHEAYAVTSRGVYHIADSTATGASWTNISGNIFNLRRNVFPSSTNSFSVSTSTQKTQPYYLPIKPAFSSSLPSVTESDLNISGHTGQTVGDLSVTLSSLNATNLGSLQVVLIAPDGKTRITLYQQPGGNGTQLLNTTFSDFGSPLSSGNPPYTGSFQPSDSSVKLSDFTGQFVDGTWKLLIYNTSTTTSGTVGNFSLYFSDGSSQATNGLTSLAVDWRYNLPDNPTNPGTGPDQTHPVLYAGGNGGVFRSFNDGQAWGLFPDGNVNVTGSVNSTSANSSPLGNGGGLSNVKVSDLDTVLGYIDPTTGQPNISTGPNLLLATTYGQGSYGIRLSPVTLPNLVGQTPLLSINHTDGYSDTGIPSDGITSNQTPYITGYSEQTAFGNTVTIRIYDQTPNSPTFGQLVGIGQTDGFGKFNVQILKYDSSGNLILDSNGKPQPADLFRFNGQKILGVQATDAAGTVGNMALVGNRLSPIYLNLNVPSPATITLDPASDTGLSSSDNITNPALVKTSTPTTTPPSTTGALTFDVTVDGRVTNGNLVTPTATLMELDQNGVYVPVPGSTVPITSSTPNDPNQPPITVYLVDNGGTSGFQNGYAYTYAVKIVDALGNVYDPNGDPNSSDLQPPHTTTVIIDANQPTAANTLIQLDPGSDSGLNISVSGSTVTTGVDDNITNPNLVNTPGLHLVAWGDGSGVPTKNQTNVVFAGLDSNGLLHIRTFDATGVLTDTYETTDSNGALHLVSANAQGNVLSDVLESTLSTAQTNALASLKKNLPGLLPPHTLTSTETTQVLSQVTTILGHSLGSLTFDVKIDGSNQGAGVNLVREDASGNFTVINPNNPTIINALPDPVTGLVSLTLSDPGTFGPGGTVPDGQYTYYVEIEDVAGNTYDPSKATPPPSAPHSTVVVVDTTPPTQPQPTTVPPAPTSPSIYLDPASDSGTLGDNTTNPLLLANPNHLTFDILLASADQNSHVTLLRDGLPITSGYAIATPDPVTGLVLLQLTDPGPFSGGTPLPNGDFFYNYTVKIEDRAGNFDTHKPSTRPPLKITLSGLGANQGELSLNPASDTGLSSSDDITSPALTTAPAPPVTPLFSPGMLLFNLTLDRNSPGQVDNDTGATAYLLRSSDGGKTFDRVGTSVLTTKDPSTGLPVAQLVDPGPFNAANVAGGTYVYQAELINKAGIDNKEVATPLTVTIDETTPDPASVGVSLNAADDTGLNISVDTSTTPPSVTTGVLDGYTNPNPPVHTTNPGQLHYTVTLAPGDLGSLVTLMRSSDGGATYAPVNIAISSGPNLPPITSATSNTIPSVTESDLVVSGYNSQTVNNLSVALNGLQLTGTNASLGDLKIVLVAPDGNTLITLFNQTGATGTQLTGTTFSDSGSPLSGGTAPYSGSFQPSDSSVKLSAFNGQSINGTWKLLIYNASTTATGTLSGWSLNSAPSQAIASQLDANGNPYVVLTDSGPFDAADVADGTYLYSARVEDIAGNTDNPAQTPPQTVVIDTTPPAPATIQLDPASDTGLSSSDDITNPQDASPKNQLVFNVTIAGADQNALVTLLRDGTPVASPNASAYATATPDPTTGTITLQLIDDTSFTDGQYTYTVKIEDRAGNIDDPSQRQQLVVTIDDIKPAATSLVLDPASDTGLSSSDDVTNPALVKNTPTSQKGTLTFDVTLGSLNDVGTQVTLLRNGSPVGTPVIATLDSSTGQVTAHVRDPGPISPDGVYTYSVSLVDSAGNPSNPAVQPSLAVTIDTTNPPQPSTPILDPNKPSPGGSDSGLTGINDPAHTTNVNQPYLSGTAEPGDQVQIVDATGAGYGTAMVNSQGLYSVQASSPIPDGTYTFYILATDPAGNTSSRSGGLTITINTQAITPKPTLKLIQTDDTGLSSSDDITKVQQPHLQGTGKVGLNVEILDLLGNIPGDIAVPGMSTGGIVTNPDGTVPLVLVQPDGTFQVQINRTLDGGSYQLVARTYEPKSGNHADSAPLNLKILVLGQNSILNAPTNFGLSPSTDTGTKGDGVTSIRLYQLIGNADPNTMVNLFKVGSTQSLASATSNSQGNFTLQPPAQFVNGTISYYVRETDIAGNLGPVTPNNSTGLTIRSTTTPGDYNADGYADTITYNRSTGLIDQNNTNSSFSNVGAGPIYYNGKALTGPNFIPIQGDYNGDGVTDFGVFDYASATYYIEESSPGGLNLVVQQYGMPGHVLPIVGDFNGDGVTDFGAYTVSTSTFNVAMSNGQSIDNFQFGWPGHDQPFIGDFNGDAKSDIAMYRPDTSEFTIAYPSLATVNANGQLHIPSQGPIQYGWPGVARAIVGDFNGDGKTDLGIYYAAGSPATNASQAMFAYWYASPNPGSSMPAWVRGPGQSGSTTLGSPSNPVASNAIPVALDFNNDGKVDPSVYQPTTSQWTFAYSGSNTQQTITFGKPGGIPMAAPLYPYRLPASNTVTTASVGTLTDFIPAASTPDASSSSSSTTTTSPLSSTPTRSSLASVPSTPAASVAPAPPSTSGTGMSTSPSSLPQTFVGGAGRMALIRRLALLRQRQATLRQELLAHRASSARPPLNTLAPSGLLALQSRWRRGF